MYLELDNYMFDIFLMVLEVIVVVVHKYQLMNKYHLNY